MQKKQDLVKAVRKSLVDGKYRPSEKKVLEFVDVTLESIMNYFKDKRRLVLHLSEFGTFRVRTRHSRIGYDPESNLKVRIPAYRAISFIPVKKAFREIIES